jgi:hypothetical protein
VALVGDGEPGIAASVRDRRAEGLATVYRHRGVDADKATLEDGNSRPMNSPYFTPMRKSI